MKVKMQRWILAYQNHRSTVDGHRGRHDVHDPKACDDASSSSQRARSNARTRLLTPRNFRQMFEASRTRNSTLISSYPCARCRQLFRSIALFYATLACGGVV